MYFLKLGLVLLIIAAIASAVLAFVNNITYPIIEENQRLAEEEARQEVLQKAKYFIEFETPFSYYAGMDIENNIIGYTFIASGPGYSGNIDTMVGIDSNFVITQIKVINQTETPGLGANCSREEFRQKFKGLRTEDLKVGSENIYITGATITARTITDSIKERIIQLQKYLQIEREKRQNSFDYQSMEEAI